MLSQAYHLLQVFSLINHSLPIPQRIAGGGEVVMRDALGEEEVVEIIWVRQVVPKVLGNITSFFKMLDRRTGRIWSGGWRNWTS